jgi:predicted MFS family arabinose efflux permease
LDPTHNDAPTLSWPHRLRIILPFAVGYFLSYLFRVINAVIAPDLAVAIGLDPADLGLLTAAYFITFAAFQLPLGVLLDRFGPRRIEASLLVAAAIGAFVFANSRSLAGLVIGRGLIGLGVSACLMAAFKAFVIWFPRRQLPLINGFQMAAGGMGALAATAPVETLLGFTDWRGVFSILGLFTAAVAAVIFLLVPDRKESRSGDGLGDLLHGVGEVFTSPTFWRIAPWATLSQAGFLSIHGLWSGPWMRDVAGMDRSEAAGLLLLVAGAMVAGFIVFGSIAERLGQMGVPTMTVAGTGMGLFMGVVLAMVVLPGQWVEPLWMMFGFFGTSSILVYAVFSQHFPAHLSGRVSTALNLMVFVSAFGAQWGMGAVIGQWPTSASGGYAPEGYRAAFGVILVLQGAALLWFAAASAFFRNPRRGEQTG